MKDRLVLISRWHLNCTIEQAWHCITAIRQWPRWWPNVSAVQLETDAANDDTPRVGSTARIDWKTRLGYGLKLRVTTTSVVAPFELEGAAEGDLNGRGLWMLEPVVDDANTSGVMITYRWDVHLNRLWMRRLSPLLRPVFAWNHFDVMRTGAKSMARHIACRMTRYQDFRFAPGSHAEELDRTHWRGHFAMPQPVTSRGRRSG